MRNPDIIDRIKESCKATIDKNNVQGIANANLELIQCSLIHSYQASQYCGGWTDIITERILCKKIANQKLKKEPKCKYCQKIDHTESRCPYYMLTRNYIKTLNNKQMKWTKKFHMQDTAVACFCAILFGLFVAIMFFDQVQCIWENTSTIDNLKKRNPNFEEAKS